MPTTSTIITITTGTLLVGLAAYAIYFDYTRRHDAQFRKKLRKEKKRVDRSNASLKATSATSSKTSPTDEELDAALELVRSEEIPTSPEEKEQYFMQNLAVGEQLSAQGLALPAALAFYRAMRVYPEPLQLVMILEKTLPEEMFRLVVNLMGRDVKYKADVFYKYFPPKSMNVSVKLVSIENPSGKGQVQKATLIAAKDFEIGDIIYKEKPIVCSLDADLIGTGKYCSNCLRAIHKGSAIQSSSDPSHSSYCSQVCHDAAEHAFQALLFGIVPPSTPGNPLPQRTPAELQERRSIQLAFIDYIKKSGIVAPLLIVRFTGQLLSDEHHKLMGEELKDDLPKADTEGKVTYTYYDYIERLRSLEIILSPKEVEEMDVSRKLLSSAIEGLEAFLEDEKYLTLKGKLAYNCYGVGFSGGRSDRPIQDQKEMVRTRTPLGTSRQIGSAFYRVSSYINHSCAPSARPSFENGTSEMHLIAQRAIKAGEEITVSYVDTARHSDEKTALDARKHRRMELALGWGFACDCTRCKEEAVSMKLTTGESSLFSSSAKVKLEPAVERYLNANE